MANNYTLNLKAVIDPKQITEQLDKISKQYKFNISVDSNGLKNIEATIKKVQDDTNNKAKTVQLIDAETQLKTIETIKARFLELQTDVQSVGKVTLSNGGTSALVNYTNSLGMAGTQTMKLNQETETWDATLKNKISQSIPAVEDKLASFGQEMVATISRTVQYSISLGVLYAALNQLKDGIQYVQDLNKELTNIRLVTGQSKESAEALGKEYNQMAKELGVTTLEVTKGATEWIRQGKSAEETAQLIRQSTKLAALGNMESAESAEKLTAIMNGFKLSANETAPVLDKLVALDNNFATSVGEITTALKYSSNSAQQAGVDFDHLAAYITVVSSVTRQSSETVGQAMKTMLARFTDIKANKLDEDGLGINNVESSLARVNIKLRDSKNHFRNIQDVIAELGEKWSSLNQVEQDNIAKSIAGVRQKEQFLVIMNHQVDIQKALTTEIESTGLAENRYKIKLESAETATNRLTDAWNGVWQATMNSDGIIFFDTIISKLLEMVEKMGGFVALFKAAGFLPLLNILDTINANPVFNFIKNSGQITTGTAAGNASQAQAMKAKYLEDQKKATDDLAVSTDKLTTSEQQLNDVSQDTTPIFNLSDSLKELDNSVKDTSDLITKATAGKLEYADIQKLIAKDPSYIDMISIENGKIVLNIEKLKELDIQKAKDALATAEQVLATDKNNVEYQKTVDVMKLYLQSLQDGTAYADAYAKGQEEAAKAAEEASKKYLESLKLQVEGAKKLLDMVVSMIRQEKEEEKQHLQDQLDNYNQLIDARIAALDALKAEEDYKRGLQKDTKKAADIKSQIAILMLDNSPEAKAKILLLQKQLADQTDKIKQEERDHSFKQQKQALENEKKEYKKFIDDKIKVIENYLKEGGQIVQDAINMIQNHGQEVYNQLMEWNREYGTGIDQDVTNAWNNGYSALLNYYQLLREISEYKATLPPTPENPNPPLQNPPTLPPPPIDNGSGGTDNSGKGTGGGKKNWMPYHDGLDRGPVGGIHLKSNEELAVLLKGERVINEGQASNFMNNILPNIAKPTSNFGQNSGLRIENLLTVNGNLDKTVLPDVEKMVNKAVEKLNKIVLDRGVKRQSNLSSI